MIPVFRRKRSILRSGVRQFLRRIGQTCAAVWRWVSSKIERLSGQWRRKVVISAMLEADVLLASPRTLHLSPIALIHRLTTGALYVHSMLYVGDGKILHTTTRKGVTVDRVPGKVYQPSRYSLYRVPRLTRHQRRAVVTAALQLKYKKLDRAALVTNIPARLLGFKRPLLRFEKNRIWCSKLICDAYAMAGVELLPPEESESVTSDDLARSSVLERIELSF